MTTHPSTLAWKFPWTQQPSGLQSSGGGEGVCGVCVWGGHKQSDMTEHASFFYVCIEKNGASPVAQQVKNLLATPVTQEMRV